MFRSSIMQLISYNLCYRKRRLITKPVGWHNTRRALAKDLRACAMHRSSDSLKPTQVNPQTIHKFAFGCLCRYNSDTGQKLSIGVRVAQRTRAGRKRNQSAGSCLLIVRAINKSREEERIRSPFAASDVNATMLVWMRLLGGGKREGERGQSGW